MTLTVKQLAAAIDHTQLRAYATETDLRELCDEARQYGFATVAVNPVWTSYCARKLAGSGVGVCTCVGFPLGANTAPMKVEEAKEAVKNGATEIDMVINIGALKSGYAPFVEKEIRAIVNAVKGVPVKVILECSYLNDEEKEAVCKMSVLSGAAFVKTSTGYGASGATVDDVELMAAAVGGKLGVKAAGGIRAYSDAIAMIEAGATRIGTSAGVRILETVPQ